MPELGWTTIEDVRLVVLASLGLGKSEIYDILRKHFGHKHSKESFVARISCLSPARMHPSEVGKDIADSGADRFEVDYMLQKVYEVKLSHCCFADWQLTRIRDAQCVI